VGRAENGCAVHRAGSLKRAAKTKIRNNPNVYSRIFRLVFILSGKGSCTNFRKKLQYSHVLDNIWTYRQKTRHGSRLTAHGSRLTAHGSRLTAHGSYYTLNKRNRVKCLTPQTPQERRRFPFGRQNIPFLGKNNPFGGKNRPSGSKNALSGGKNNLPGAKNALPGGQPPTTAQQVTVETFLVGRHELGVKIICVTGTASDPANKGCRIWHTVGCAGGCPARKSRGPPKVLFHETEKRRNRVRFWGQREDRVFRRADRK
jgi:hypothetical protein